MIRKFIIYLLVFLSLSAIGIVTFIGLSFRRYDVSEERRKWIGYFDNRRVIRFGMEEVPVIRKELMGKGIMLVYASQGDDKSNAWKRMVKIGAVLWGKWD